MARSNAKKPRERHRFFLNPYENAAFTRCPKCNRPTKIRKFPLAIHIEPRQLFLLNKACRYCEKCDLIIAKKAEVESLMAAGFERTRPEIIGNEYLVFGVLERKDWQESRKGGLSDSEVVDRVIVFRDVWDFEVIPGGWYPDPDADLSKR